MKKRLSDYLSRMTALGAEKVKILATNDGLTCRFPSKSREVIGEVSLLNYALGLEGEINLFAPEKLQKILNVMDENISITFVDVDRALVVSDSKTKAQCMLSSSKLSVVPSASFKSVKEEAVIKLTPEFISTFKKAIASMDTLNVAFKMINDSSVKSKSNVIINYNKTDDGDNIKFPIDVEGEFEGVVIFNAQLILAALNTNSDADLTLKIVSVPNNVFGHLVCTAKEYTSNYYIMQLSN